jgi:hypothetical protein
MFPVGGGRRGVRERERERESVCERYTCAPTTSREPQGGREEFISISLSLSLARALRLSLFLMRKKNDDGETNIINKNVEKITKNNNNKQKPTHQASPEVKNIIQPKEKPNVPRDRKAYLNECYERNKQKMKEQIKNKKKEKTYKIRLLREINNGLIEIKTVRKSKLEKYNIKFDEKSNKNISE